MYVLQKKQKTVFVPKSTRLVVAVITPSTPHNEIVRFTQIVREVIELINRDFAEPKWDITVLSQVSGERSPSLNYSSIYNADIIIAECSEKKPNVFYMIGLAHAFGRPVCSCYKVKPGQNADIPFNVHGRQSLTYSLTTTGLQKEFKNNLKEWIKKYE